MSIGHRPATRAEGEERLAECPPDAGRRDTRALRRLHREQGLSSHVFMSERDGPMTPKAFHALFGRIGERAKMQFPIHPYMLRHGCGYALANAGHDTRALQAWLGHKNIQHTVRYAELAPDRFKNFWR
jgi:site-specific recombinase XerD